MMCFTMFYVFNRIVPTWKQRVGYVSMSWPGATEVLGINRFGISRMRTSALMCLAEGVECQGYAHDGHLCKKFCFEMLCLKCFPFLFTTKRI